MELQPYVDTVRHELNVAARAGGDDAAALADRLSAPLESTIRLVVLEALSHAAEEITRELAPASVDVRLRGRDPEFVVTTAVPPPATPPTVAPAAPKDAGDDGGTWRVTLRLPETMRPKVEAAARWEGVSVNTWLVRAAAGRVKAAERHGTESRHQVSGWVR